MNVEQFQASPAGQLVQARANDTAYWAFVPNPLPPPLVFDNELARSLAEAAGALGELAGLGRAIPNANLLIQPFIRREAVLSSRIEGTQTDLADLYAYEAGQLALPGLTAATPPPEADLREVANYVRALEYGLERIRTLPLSNRLLRELHERLMAGVRGELAQPGEFRHTQNLIGSRGDTLVTAKYVPPPSPEMQAALDALESYFHAEDDLHPLARLALIHYQFEAIHPFCDGNGRIGRLLISLLLVNWNLLPSPLLYLSAYFERNRQGYYDRLLAVSAAGAWRDWLLYFLRGVKLQAQDAIDRAKQLQDLQFEWRNRVTKARNSVLLSRLVDLLFEKPAVTVAQTEQLLGVSYRTANLNVQKLVKLGILHQSGETAYDRTFVAKEIFQIILRAQSVSQD